MRLRKLKIIGTQATFIRSLRKGDRPEECYRAVDGVDLQFAPCTPEEQAPLTALAERIEAAVGAVLIELKSVNKPSWIELTYLEDQRRVVDLQKAMAVEGATALVDLHPTTDAAIRARVEAI